MKYQAQGTCCRTITFDVRDGKVYKIGFDGGCRGNHQGIAALCEGRSINEVIDALAGIPCRGGTSCPDQLAKALTAYKKAQAEAEQI